MPYLQINEVQPGQYLGHTIFGENGNILLQKGVQLTASYIKKLSERGYYSLYVLDNLEDKIEIQDIVSPRVRNNAVTLLRKTINYVAQEKTPRAWSDSIQRKDQLAQQILLDMEHNETLKADLINLKCVNEYTVEHSINVGVMAGYVGLQVGLNMKQVRDVIKAGIYHDIGKTFVENDILNKPASLSTQEMIEIRKHPENGFKLLMNQLNISPIISIGSHLHHERWDGSGYPNGMKEEQIHLYGRIVAVIDVFDAMTSDRVYHRARSNKEVPDYINSKSGSHFAPDIVETLSNIVYPYPTGSKVRLGDNRVAVVLSNSPEDPHRPLVRIAQSNGQQGDVYNLAKEPKELQIQASVM